MKILSRESWHPQREESEANGSSEEFEGTDVFFLSISICFVGILSVLSVLCGRLAHFFLKCRSIFSWYLQGRVFHLSSLLN